MPHADRRHGLGLLVLLVLALCSCQQGSADGDSPEPSANVIYPVEATAVRLLAEAVDAADVGCPCGEPSALARPTSGAPSGACLGARGFLIVRMSASFTNGADVDLRIYEWGSEHGGVDDRFSVYVSVDGREWTLVAEAISNDPGRSYASIDLGDARDHYVYVKVVPAATGLDGDVEIVAIEALNPSIPVSL